MRILLADDSAVARALTTQLLSRWGHEVVVVHDGDEASAALETDREFDMALLDWEMPGLTGPEICSRVKAEGRVEAPYMILLTGREAEADSRSALEAGADDYLVKPFQPGDLRVRVGLGARVVALSRRVREQAAELESLRARLAGTGKPSDLEDSG